MMNYNRQIIWVAAMSIALLSSACQNDNVLTDEATADEVALTFAPTVAEMNTETVDTRAITNTFFVKGDEITLKVTTDKAAEKSYIYKYDEKGVFNGKDATNTFRFKLDNTFVKSLVAEWPTEEVRKQGVVLDQREEGDYKLADRLTATSSTINVMPTAEPVPLNFKHDQSRFTFRMAGQNANGLNIESLILELQYDDPYDKKDENVAGAFWAYCNNTETAELILLPDMEIEGGKPGYPIVVDRYMIGMATVGNATTRYTGGIWLNKDTKVTLKASTDYLVTLTPEGYNLIATIEVHGFGQSEGYVGIPLQKPAKSTIEEVDYDITTALQLMTVSRYVAGKVNTENADDWKNKKYRIADKLEMTVTARPYFIPFKQDEVTFQTIEGTFLTAVALEDSTDPFNLFE